jgi:D-serine deaminase-like pyridoxal phosphate-dependent protein
MRLADAPTPSLVLDRGKFERNCDFMHERCESLGVRLRPHMKTLKSIDAARIAMDPQFGAIAVSTLREAEYFADGGIEDIQLALCLTPDKLPRAAAVAARIRRFSFFLDSVDMARAAAQFVAAHPAEFGVWIEIDSGEHRTGVDPDDRRLVEIASILADGAVPLEGVATHGGHSYRARNRESLAAVAEEERQAVVRAAESLRAAGFTVPGVSAGSTPTAVHSRSAEGLTEYRAGVYMAGDLFQAAIGSLDTDEIALSVLASVISHKPEQNQIVVDAGGLALSKDRSTSAIEGGDLGYGLVVDMHGQPNLGHLVVGNVSQEHGQISGPDPAPFDRLPIGAKVRLVPNHVCMTAGNYDELLIVDGGTEIVARWDKALGW